MDPLDRYLADKQAEHLEDLLAFLRMESVSTNPAKAPDVAACAAWVAAELERAGLKATLHPTAGHPIVYGEWLGAPGAPTLLLYGHYDVQPPEPLELWRNPPFSPTLEEGARVVARGATDDKGQVLAHVKALQALMELHGRLPVNVKVVIEGEEEIGSPNLPPFLEEHRERLRADAVLVSDSSMWAPGRPALMVSLRGLAYVEIEVTGPSHDLHSGLFGGGVANPLLGLSKVLAALHDDEGRVMLPGFYDKVRPLSADERAEMASLGHDEAAELASLGLAEGAGEAGYSFYERTSARPTLDANGMWGGYTGPGAKTVLPSKAYAKVSCRLVPDQCPEEVSAAFEAFVNEHLPAGLSAEVRAHHGAVPVMVPRDIAAFGAAERALEHVWGVPPVYTRGGGSIPIIATFQEVLGVGAVLMGLGLQDDRLHSPNEKFELSCYYQGIRAAAWTLIEMSKQA